MKFSYRIWLLTGALSNIFEKYKSLFKYVVRKILTKDLFFCVLRSIYTMDIIEKKSWIRNVSPKSFS